MGQTNFEFRFDFDRVDDAKSLHKNLNQLSNEHRGDLALVLQALLDRNCGEPDEIDIENIERKQSSVYLHAYGGRHCEPPFAVAASIHQLGCPSAYLRVFYDEGEDAAYYLGDKRVKVNEFVAATQGDRYAEVEAQLYLPPDRVQVEATLVEHEWHETYYGEFCVMKFETRDGHEFYYKGNSKKLLLLTQDEYAPEVSFSATFEKGYLALNSPPVSLVRRPTKISVRQLDAKSEGLATLRGDNKQFADEAIGEVVRLYFEDYAFDCNAFFKTLERDRFLQHDFKDLLKRAAKSEIEHFQAFGLRVHASSWRKASLSIECEQPQVRVDIKGLRRQVRDLGFEFFAERDDRNFYAAEWATDEIYLEIGVQKKSVKLTLCNRVKVCHAGKSVKAQYAEFNNEPGYASKADWLVLFELARADAEAGNTESFPVYADLLDSGRAWERQPELAKQWRDRAGERGDAGALVQAGMRLNTRKAKAKDIEQALDYFRRGGEMGHSRGWDEFETTLKRNAGELKSYQVETIPADEMDRSHWLSDDKDWMRARRASWKELEPMLKPNYKVKELAGLKKYYLTGELPVVEFVLDSIQSMLNLRLLELLWFHPSNDADLLLQIRNSYFKQTRFQRRTFGDWQKNRNSSIFVKTPAGYRTDNGQNPIVTDDNLLYFKTINGGYKEHGYWVHGVFIPFSKSREGFRELLNLGQWFRHDELNDVNRALVYLDPEALDWWHKMLPDDEDFFEKPAHEGLLPYLFVALYRLQHFSERDIDCPLREDLGARLRKILDEKPFIDEIKRLWLYVRDGDFKVDGVWQNDFDARDIWPEHRDKY